MNDERPDLSVVLPVSAAWPAPERALDSILRSAAPVDAEVIVVDGTGTLPEVVATKVRVLTAPSSDPFALRALGVGAARGEVVAVTEDHCVVEPNWCTDIVDVHRSQPHAHVAVGIVLNGSPERRSYRAKFLTTHGHLLRPLDPAELTTLPVSNFSCKRSLVEDPIARGWLEQVLMPRAVSEGDVALCDATVWHSQPMSLRRSLGEEFHNGRATAGLALQGRPWRERRRYLPSALRLMPRSLAALRAASARGALTHELWRECRPFTFAIFTAASAGQVIGVVWGPGASPERIGR
jgi:hypothetical protein